MFLKLMIRYYSQITSFHTIIVLITLSQIGTIRTDCPKTCGVCLISTIICENGGFLEFPTKFQSTIENLTLVGHHFTSNIMGSVNMTGLKSLKLLYLAIRSSSIQEIQNETFALLHSLKTLDLSENQILKINNFAFQGLNLHTLKLNDIGKLKLFKYSFSNFRVKILSIVNSRLGVLDYDIFSNINMVYFKSFQISNNNFRTIDQRFEIMFSKLKSVNLIGNPFVCNCSLLWLKRLSLLINHEIFNINFPKCVSPSALRNRRLPEILESEFKCLTPKINEIGINFVTPYIADLTCQVDTFKTRAHQTEVMWIEKYAKSSRPSSKSKDYAYLRVKKSDFKHYEYQCVAQNKVGKTSIIVFLDWPSSMKTIKTNFSSPTNEYSPSLDGFPWNTSFYFKRRYTLVELIVAIITSFITTILLFIITYKICLQTPSCPAFRKKSHLTHEKFLSNSNVLVSRYHPSRTSYGADNALHSVDSNSQTYDCISISNAIYPHQILTHGSNTLPGQFLDYKTHERLYTTQLDQ